MTSAFAQLARRIKSEPPAPAPRKPEQGSAAATAAAIIRAGRLARGEIVGPPAVTGLAAQILAAARKARGEKQ